MEVLYFELTLLVTTFANFVCTDEKDSKTLKTTIINMIIKKNLSTIFLSRLIIFISKFASPKVNVQFLYLKFKDA